MYEDKIAVVVLDNLATWQKLNVTAFLASSIAIAYSATHGAPLVNASGEAYLPFMKHPVLVYKADTDEQLTRAFNRAKDRNLHLGIYTKELFSTKNEEENLQEIARFTDEELSLAGIVIYGEHKKVSKALDGLKLHA